MTVLEALQLGSTVIPASKFHVHYNALLQDVNVVTNKTGLQEQFQASRIERFIRILYQPVYSLSFSKDLGQVQGFITLT